MSPLAAAAAALLVLVWGAAIRLGLGAALLGPDATPGDEALLLLPAVAAAVAVLAWDARRHLTPVAARWRPGVVVPGFERPADRPRAAQVLAEPEPLEVPDDPTPPPPAPPRAFASPASAPPAPRPADVVALGASADPAWASWLLRWEAPGHGRGVVVLPSGDHVLFGRDPDADLVAQLDQVSWHHLEFVVRRDEVVVMDLGSSNGTRTCDGADEVELAPRAPARLAPFTELRLASPCALTLTLEPLT